MVAKFIVVLEKYCFYSNFRYFKVSLFLIYILQIREKINTYLPTNLENYKSRDSKQFL